jgi:hypothetical protein
VQRAAQRVLHALHEADVLVVDLRQATVVVSGIGLVPGGPLEITPDDDGVERAPAARIDGVPEDAQVAAGQRAQLLDAEQPVELRRVLERRARLGGLLVAAEPGARSPVLAIRSGWCLRRSTEEIVPSAPRAATLPANRWAEMPTPMPP